MLPSLAHGRSRLLPVPRRSSGLRQSLPSAQRQRCLLFLSLAYVSVAFLMVALPFLWMWSGDNSARWDSAGSVGAPPPLLARSRAGPHIVSVMRFRCIHVLRLLPLGGRVELEADQIVPLG